MAKKRFKPFHDARDFVRKLGFKSLREWADYAKSGKKPKDIPTSPRSVYKQEWKGMPNWLGIERKSFEEARKFVRTLGLKSWSKWKEYCKSGKKPGGIPSKPEQVYKQEWKGMSDWLGTTWRNFEDAREFARSLDLKRVKEWADYAKSGKKPNDIPSTPNQIYKDKGWKGMSNWLGLKRKSFEDARKFARTLGLKSQKDWKEYCKSGKKPGDIPSQPQKIYKKEYNGIKDWLGYNRYRSFEDARAYIHSLKLKNRQDWSKFCSSGNKPDDIPSSPQVVYKQEWKGQGDWFGTMWRNFEDAREFVRTLGLKNWKEYCKSGKKPDDIPSSPQVVYKQEWKGMPNWLGIGWKSFEEAKAFARITGLKTGREWIKFCKVGKKLSDGTLLVLQTGIPRDPKKIYKKKWTTWGDFLGTGIISNSEKEFRTFEDARAYVLSLNLKNQKDWREYCKSGKKPGDIPVSPQVFYKQEWKGMLDYFGFEVTKLKSFKKAKKFVRTLGLYGQKEWREYCKSGNKPEDIPANPDSVYKGKGWKGMPDFLGFKGKISKYNTRSFNAARKFVRTLGLKSQKEWKDYCTSGKKPGDIPSKPEQVYKQEWKGMGDFLGTGRIPNQERDILSYNEAEKKAWRICKKLNINTPIEWANAHRAGKIPKNLPSQPEAYYQKKRGIAKNVENEFYTTWFKFSGTSSKWTEEVAWYKIKKLVMLYYKTFRHFSYSLDISNHVEPHLYLLLYTNYILKAVVHKREFTDKLERIMKRELGLDEINFKGKVDSEILIFYLSHYTKIAKVPWV